MNNMDDMFLQDLRPTLDHEGGISNHVNDPGLFTFMGISEAKHPDEKALWNRVTNVLMDYGAKAAVQDAQARRMVAKIYFDNYYAPLNCARFPGPRLRRKVFDTAVNVGRRRCARWLQRALNIADRGSDDVGLVLDGGIGNATIEVLQRYSGEDEFLTKQVTGFQMTHYQTLCERKKKFESFIRGWTNRAYEGVLGEMNAIDHALADVITMEDIQAAKITGDPIADEFEPAWGLIAA